MPTPFRSLFFVLLAGAHYERTADRSFAESIWPNVEAALAVAVNIMDFLKPRALRQPDASAIR